jgi:hypothetical protein
VGLDPHGKVSDPCTYKPDLRVRSKTSTGVPGPLGQVPGPPYAGSGPLTARSRDSGTKNTQALIKVRWGPEPTRVRIIPRTLPLPAHAETRCCHVAYCP